MHKIDNFLTILKKHRHILQKAILGVLFLYAHLAVSQVDTLNKINSKNDSIQVTKPKTKGKTSSDVETTVNYNAKDSIRFDIASSIVRLYGDAKIVYGAITLTAEKITIDWKNNEILAEGVIDSLGNKKGIPVFTEASDKYVAEEIKYNFKTKKGIINRVVTQQGEGYVHGDKIKKNEKNEIFVDHARYTTCNHAEPHFWIDANKIKLIPNNKFISGPFNLVIEGVRTPLVFPLGFFPLPKKRSSGLIIPAYGESKNSGFFLQNGGFYWAVNDYIGAKIIGQVWTNGGFTINPSVDYVKKYKYSGNFKIDYSSLANGIGERKIKSQQPPKSIWIYWSHNPISKGTSRFSANVNGGSAGFNRNNSITSSQYLTNSFKSTINYNKSFRGTPLSLGLGLAQDQNIATKVTNLNLPNLTFNVNQTLPFKNVSDKKHMSFLTNFNFSYSLNYAAKYSNVISAKKTLDGLTYEKPVLGDTLTGKGDKSLFIDSLFNNGTQAISHSLPISTSFKLFKYFNINPSSSISNSTFFKKHNYSVDKGYILKDSISTGIYNAYSINFGASASTTIFGMLHIRSKKLETIRTTMRPTASFVYTPNFKDNSYQTVQDSTGRNHVLNQYLGFGGSVPGSSFSRMWTFSMNNLIEMKVKKYTDTSMKYQNVTLFDNIGLGTSYNGATEKWSNLVVNARTVFLKKLNINGNLSFDPYEYKDSTYISSNKKEITIGVLQKNIQPHATSADLSVTTSLNNSAFEKNRKEENQMTPAQVAFYRANPNMKYVDFKIPWDLSMSYNIIWRHDMVNKLSGQTTQTFNFNGNVSLTDKWKVAFGSGIDLIKKEISLGATNFRIVRDLHCWQMNMAWNPFNPYATYTFNINVKASSLSDLKVTKRGQGNY